MPIIRLLTRTQLAELLGLTPSGLDKLLARGDGPPAIRSGRFVRFALSDVEAWLASRKSIKAA